jgi:iron complex outermembrane recepter protein
MTLKNKFGFFLRSTSVTALAAACCAFGGQALAQDNSELETVVVTGTAVGTNIADVAPVGTESIVLDREKLTATGLTSVTDITRTLPQVQTTESLGREGGTQNTGGNPTQGTSINLRGLGSGATLVLVNGRRTAPTGTATTFTEASQVPLAMLERIEVLVDGASAIYGSDAVGGVVNYVTRRDLEGLQASSRYSSNHGYSEWGATATGGLSWNSIGALGKGNFILSYDYDQRTSMKSGSQPFLRQDLRAYGGEDNRVSGTSMTPKYGTVYLIAQNGTSYSYYKVASGVTGSSVPTLSQLTLQTDKDDMSIIDTSDYSDYLGRMSRHQVVAQFNQDIFPWLNMFYEGYYTNRRTISTTETSTNPVSFESYNTYTAVDIAGFLRYPTTTTPWSVAGLLPSTIGSGTTVAQYLAINFGPATTTSTNETFTQTIGYNAKLPHDWNSTGYFIWGLDVSCGYCQFGTNVDTGAFNALATAGTINPYDGDVLTSSVMKQITGDNVQFARNMVNDFVTKFDGPLFDLPGGTVKAAVGGEYSYNTEHLRNGANRTHGEESEYSPTRTEINQFAWDSVSGLNRSIESAFVELYVPLIGEDMKLPLIKSFNVDAAVRYDSYSDVGDTTNPKVGATWEVNDDLQFRGSWGTSFRAPTLTDKNPYVQSFHMIFPASWGTFTNGTGDSSLDDPTVLWITGNNANVKPETSENWSLGFDYKPSWLRGFDLGLTYYSIAYSNKIDSMANYSFTMLSSAQNYATYAAYIHKISTPSGCSGTDSSTWGSDLQYWAKSVPAIYGSLDSSYVCSVNVVLDGRTANVAAQRQRGLDANIRYTLPTDNYGMFLFNLYATTLLDNKVQTVSGADFSEQIGGMYKPVRWRGRMGVNWMMDQVSVNVFVNYVGPGINDAKLYDTLRTKTPSYTTLDLGFSYRFKEELGWKGFSGTTLSINAQNAFDQNPPVILTTYDSSYDPSKYSAIGRVITLQLTKDF